MRLSSVLTDMLGKTARAMGGAQASGWHRAAALALLVPMAGIALLAAAVAVETTAEDRNPIALGLCLGWLGLAAMAARAAATGQQRAIAAIALVASSFAWRFWSIHFASGVALGADPMNYQNLAHALLDGRGLITDDWRYGRDLRAYFPPLYPVLLAGWWRLFGDAPVATLVMTTLTDIGTALALVDIGRRLGRPAAGWLAGLLFFAYPPFALAAAIPQKEALTILLITLMLRGTIIWWTDTSGHRRARHGLALGALWGLLALTQPGAVLLPVTIALALVALRGWPATLRLGLWSIPAFLLVMAPWWVRNWLVFGAFVPFTTASGFMVNVALGTHGLPIPDSIFSLPEPERSAVMGREAMRRIGAQPLDFLTQTARALIAGFGYEEATIARFRHTTPPIGSAMRAILTGPLQIAYLSLLVAAAIECWRRWRAANPDPLVPIGLAMLTGIGAVNMWFEWLCCKHW